jgi:hypothetical protein
VGKATLFKDKNGKNLVWSDCRDGIVYVGRYLSGSEERFGSQLAAQGASKGSNEYWRQILNSYNSGRPCAIGSDSCTTGNDYGSDVLKRAADVEACLGKVSSDFETKKPVKVAQQSSLKLNYLSDFGIISAQAQSSDRYRWITPGGSFDSESFRSNGKFTRGDDGSGGIDYTISAPGKAYEQSRNTPIISHESGVVTHIQQSNSGYGNQVGVYYPKLGVTAIYSHLETTDVQKGSAVSPGSLLGRQGSSGNTRGGDDGTGKGFVHTDLRLYDGRVEGDPGGVLAWQDNRYNTFFGGMLDYYNANEQKILAQDFSPTASGSGNTGGTGECECVETAFRDNKNKIAQNSVFGFRLIFGTTSAQAQTKSLLSNISDVIEKREGSQKGEGFAGYNNPGNIKYDSLLQKRVDEKFGPGKIKRDTVNPQFAAFEDYKYGRWALEDYVKDTVNGAGPYKNIKTWGDYMEVYAPSFENPTADYINDFKSIGLNKDTPIADIRGRLGDPTDGALNPSSSSTSSDPCVSGSSGNGDTTGTGSNTLLDKARQASEGKSPDGLCFTHVADYIDAVGFGKLGGPNGKLVGSAMSEAGVSTSEARNFSEFLDKDGNAEKYGIRKLGGITNPYDAPAGSIVVVAAGSPGTAHPTAGDIAVAGGGGKFYNGGNMSYGGSKEGWTSRGGGRVLGVYVPK